MFTECESLDDPHVTLKNKKKIKNTVINKAGLKSKQCLVYSCLNHTNVGEDFSQGILLRFTAIHEKSKEYRLWQARLVQHPFSKYLNWTYK